MKFFKIWLSITCLIIFLGIFFSLSSCTEASNVNYNLSSKADNFEICRRVTVYNSRTDTIIFTIEGYCSISNNMNDELVVTCKVGEDLYKKNYVYLTEYTLYVVEDIEGSVTDPFHYETHFYTALPDININK